MANLVKLHADRVEFPLHHLTYPLTPPVSKLQEGLEAYQGLKRDLALQSLPLGERRQVTGFLRRFGRLLFDTVFPGDSFGRLDPRMPLLLELGLDWCAYPWELLHDGTRWLGLSPGVIRYLFQPYQTEPVRRPTGHPLRVLAATAEPLPARPEAPVTRQAEALGAAFITAAPHLLETPEEQPPPFVYRALDHAAIPELEAALAQGTDVLLYSGYATEQGWVLETERAGPQTAAWEWLLTRVRAAARAGLELVALNDALGYLAPLTAAIQARELLRAGLSGVVRTEGRLARSREQDYWRTLVRQLARGAPVWEAHLAAVRRLHRRCEESWDWSFPRLYARAFPATGDYALEERPAGVARPVPPDEAPPAATHPHPTPPAPPQFRPQRRCLDRAADLLALAGAVQPEPADRPPLVFLTAPAGSGKTTLALELAARLRRRFARVVWLGARDLPPDPFAVAEVEAVPRNGRPPEWPLVAALAARLELPAPGAAAASDWAAALRAKCEDGRPRLIVLDRLERQPGYHAFCAGLAGLPADHRVLVLGRGAPPMLPGASFTLEPVSPGTLERLFGSALRQRLETFADGGALLRACCSDLFLARLLRRSPAWPVPEEAAAALAPPADDTAGADTAQPGTAGLVALLVDRLLDTLADDAWHVLRVLALFPALVHADLLARVSDLPARALERAVSDLQWLGLVDACDGERYFTLHPRVHAFVARRVLTPQFLAASQSRLLRACQGLLVSAATLAAEGTSAAPRPPAMAWAEHETAGVPPHELRAWQRLGVEGVNLAELAAILTEDHDWGALERLAEAVAPVAGLPALRAAADLLHHGLLAAGEARADPVQQARALGGLARPLLDAGEAERARPLLERALDRLGAATAWHVLSETYLLLGRCYEQTGNLEAAANLLHSGVELAQQTGDPEALVRHAEVLARVWARRGEPPAAAERFLQPRLAWLARRGHALHQARLSRLLADLAAQAGAPVEALERYAAVLETCRRHQAGDQTAATLLRMAACHAACDEPERAMALWRQAVALHAAPEEATAHRDVLERVAARFEALGAPDRALEAWQCLREVLQQAGERAALLAVLDRIGGLYYQLGDQSASTRCYEERLQLQAALAVP